MIIAVGPVTGFFLLLFLLCYISRNPKAVLLLIFGAFAFTIALGALMITAVGGWEQILNDFN